MAGKKIQGLTVQEFDTVILSRAEIAAFSITDSVAQVIRVMEQVNAAVSLMQVANTTDMLPTARERLAVAQGLIGDLLDTLPRY